LAEVSEVLLKQRVRNRIMEVIDVLAEPEDIARLGLFEVINLWNDFGPGQGDTEWYSGPVFTTEEIALINQVELSVEKVARANKTDLFELEDILASPEIRPLIPTAREAREVFNRRGTFSEDTELFV